MWSGRSISRPWRRVALLDDVDHLAGLRIDDEDVVADQDEGLVAEGGLAVGL
jgi:hypothetical protein